MQMLNACTMMQISGFLSACTGATGSPSACTTFQNDMANAGCLACLVQKGDGGAVTSTGGIITDSSGMPSFINTPGCIALEDKTKGPACAQALEPLIQCEFAACNSMACQMATQAEVQACAQGSDMGACSTQYSSAVSACQTDFADGGAATTVCGTDPQILDAICGSGM